MKTLKTLLMISALFVNTINASPKHEMPEKVVLVVALNPAFPGGTIVGTNLAAVEAEALIMASLDPVCNAVPQVCQARFEMTEYIVLYANGGLVIF